ncbi:MAG TPA: hypothetical protein ENK22_07130 [Persephonella sp.]|nr:hypothetical protein [Persephonella sp.]
MKNLEKLLRAYGIGLNYFDEDDPEADLLFVYRTELEKSKRFLTSSQLEKLQEYDLKALELYEKYKNFKTEAVDWLKETVKIFKSDLSPQLK